MFRLVMALVGLFLCAPVFGAVGVFSWDFAADEGGASATIEYRINHSATVAIEIIDESGQVVCPLGPFDEAGGPHSHNWDGSGSSGGHSYRARITATNPGLETTGPLVPLFTRSANTVYGIAIDKSASSPGYGTIYVSEVWAGGRIRAYYADGSPKYNFGGNPADNVLSLGFVSVTADSPWGMGVDTKGNIYAARKTGSGVASSVKVFDCYGAPLHEVSTSETTGNFWAEGLALSDRLEVYQTVGTIVRCANVSDGVWSTVMGPALTNRYTKQICFEPGGGACYVATRSNGMGSTNPGIRRYTRAQGADWAPDTVFNCGLTNYSGGGGKAADFAVGVSCDARDPDGPYTASCLWIGLDIGNGTFGGNIVRKPLPTGTPQFYYGPGILARIVAGDAVGNVAIEYGSQLPANPCTAWGLYAVGDESSSDTRVTNEVTFQGTASPELVGRIADLRERPDGSYVELTQAKTVSAVYGDGFYLQESDRECGIKVMGVVAPTEGSAVKVRGYLASVSGERVVNQAEIVQ